MQTQNSSLATPVPMALRTDESHVSLPGTNAENLAEVAFRASARLSMVAEGSFSDTVRRLVADAWDLPAVILRYHQDRRLPQPCESSRATFAGSIDMVLQCLSDLPSDLNRTALAKAGSVQLSPTALSFIWAIRLFVKQQYICIELYHRYMTILPVDMQARGHSKVARIAGIIISALGPLPRDCIDAIGPPYLDMIYKACLYLQECLPHLDDPFDKQQATADGASYFALLEQIDALRRTNAINVKPRAYNASKSLAPSRSGSPGPDQATLEVDQATSLDATALLFDDTWLTTTGSFADPSVGSMGLVNMLPYFNVPGYQAALEAYTYSPSENGTSMA